MPLPRHALTKTGPALTCSVSCEDSLVFFLQKTCKKTGLLQTFPRRQPIT